MSLWVRDASPLIFLGKLGRLELLSQLADERVVPYEVWKEIMNGPNGDQAKDYLTGNEKYFIRTHQTVMVSAVDVLSLGRGESAVLSRCLEARLNATAVLDDRAARFAAKRFGIQTLGTLGILLRAKRKGLLRELAPDLRKLRNAGANLSNGLIREVLMLAGEWEPHP